MEEGKEAAAKSKDLNMQKLKDDVGARAVPCHQTFTALAAPGVGGPGALASMQQRLSSRGRLTPQRPSRTAAHTHMMDARVRLGAADHSDSRERGCNMPEQFYLSPSRGSGLGQRGLPLLVAPARRSSSGR